MRTEQIDAALGDDWWAGEDEAWEAGALALAQEEPRALAWSLTVWLAVAVVGCAVIALAAVAVYGILGLAAV